MKKLRLYGWLWLALSILAQVAPFGMPEANDTQVWGMLIICNIFIGLYILGRELEGKSNG